MSSPLENDRRHPDSLSSAERRDLEQETLRRAKRLARGRRVPPGLERVDLEVVAQAGALLGIDKYRPERGLDLRRFLDVHAIRAMQNEARAMDPLEKSRRAKLRCGAAKATPWELTPLSFEEGRDADGELAGGWNVDPGPDPLDVTITASERLEILKAIKLLRWRERWVVRLRFYEELPFPAVGAALGVSASGARKILRVALERLRRQLEERGFSAVD